MWLFALSGWGKAGMLPEVVAHVSSSVEFTKP